MNNCKRTMPSRSLLQGGVYVNAASTDIKTRFEQMKRERLEQQSVNVAPIRRRQK